MVPRQQSSLSTSAAVRNDVTDCRLAAERSNQLDVPSQRLCSVPPLVREAGALRLDLAVFAGMLRSRLSPLEDGHSHRCPSPGRDVPRNYERSRIDGAQATMLA